MRLLLFVALFFLSCAYQRRSTPLSPVQRESDNTAPSGVVRIELDGIEIPLQDRGARDWDEDGSGPDAFLRIYVGDELVYESEVVEDTTEPSFDITTGNLYLPSNTQVRFEVWDRDFPRSNAIVGSWQGRGLPPTALLNATARVPLEGGATLRLIVRRANAYRGTGVTSYEVRNSGLHVLNVIRFSPAGRAGLQSGDTIVAIDGQTIAELGDGAPGALSMAASRGSTLEVQRGESTETLSLDRQLSFPLASELE